MESYQHIVRWIKWKLNRVTVGSYKLGKEAHYRKVNSTHSMEDKSWIKKVKQNTKGLNKKKKISFKTKRKNQEVRCNQINKHRRCDQSSN